MYGPPAPGGPPLSAPIPAPDDLRFGDPLPPIRFAEPMAHVIEPVPIDEQVRPVPHYEMAPHYEPVPVPFASPRRARRRVVQEVPGSKRDRRRKELIERLDHTHWEGFEHRDIVFQDAHHALTQTYHMLLNRPGMLRDYAMSLAEQGLSRNTALRKTALYHAFLVERSTHSHDVESTRAEDEARSARRSVRDKLLAVVEDRKRQLHEERDGGEFSASFMLDPNQRQHSTRQLRNKSSSRLSRTGSGTSGLGEEDDSNAALNTGGAMASLLGWSETDTVATMIAAATDAAEKEYREGNSDAAAAVHTLRTWSAIMGDGSSSLFGAPNGPTPLCGIACSSLAAAGINFPPNEVFSSPTSLLASASNMNNGTSKNKKKGSTKGGSSLSAADRATVSSSDGDEGQNTRATNIITTGGGRLRWDTAKCLSQLSSARDIEVEADLIHIRKIGAKRRRR